MKRDNCGQTEAEQRIAAQMNIETKMKLADYVLDNQGDLKSTKLQATDIFRRLTESHWHLVSKTIFTVGLTLVSLVIYHYFNGHP